MGKCYLYGNGGSNQLNFMVVGGTTEPTNPVENTIWLNTSERITSYTFSVGQPTKASGKVWISLGAASAIKFDALKKNGLMVYIGFAKQCTNDEYKEVPAKIYQSGAWKDLWDGTLYSSGDEYSIVTGGWIGSARSLSDTSAVVPTVTKNTSFMEFVVPSIGGSFLEVSKEIDISNYNKVTFRVEGGAHYSQYTLAVYKKGATSLAASSFLGTEAVVLSDYDLDISSLSGSYVIGIYGYCGSASEATALKIHKVHLS